MSKALAKAFAQENCHLALNDYDEKGLLQAAEELKSITGQKIITSAFDVSKREKFEAFAEMVEDEFSKVDVVINNAGQLINKPFIETSINEFKLQFDANYFTAVNLIKACYEKLHSKSHIVNISSMGGFQGSSKFSGLSAYSTSKGAVSILTECLAAEFAETPIKVNALALGAVGTEMLNNAFPGYTAPVSAESMADYIVSFAFSGAKYYNGKVLPVALGNP